VGQRAQQSIAGEIHGQVRVENQPAPPGILVLLDVAPGMQSGLVGSGQESRTMTDTAGKFLFDNVPVVRGVQEKIRRSQFKRRPPIVAKVSSRSTIHDFMYLRDWGY